MREHRHLALGEVDDPGRAVDQHERQRQRAVDRAVGDAVDRRAGRTAPLRPSQVGAADALVGARSPRPCRRARAARSRARRRGRRSSSTRLAFCSTISMRRALLRRSRRRILNTSRVISGASPSDGSSSSISRGRSISAAGDREHLLLAAATASRACWRAALLQAREAAEAAPRCPRPTLAVVLARVGAERAGSPRRSASANVPRPSGTCATPRRTIRSRRAADQLACRRSARCPCARDHAGERRAASSSCRRRWRRGS